MSATSASAAASVIRSNTECFFFDIKITTFLNFTVTLFPAICVYSYFNFSNQLLSFLRFVSWLQIKSFYLADSKFCFLLFSIYWFWVYSTSKNNFPQFTKQDGWQKTYHPPYFVKLISNTLCPALSALKLLCHSYPLFFGQT